MMIQSEQCMIWCMRVLSVLHNVLFFNLDIPNNQSRTFVQWWKIDFSKFIFQILLILMGNIMNITAFAPKKFMFITTSILAKLPILMISPLTSAISFKFEPALAIISALKFVTDSFEWIHKNHIRKLSH